MSNGIFLLFSMGIIGGIVSSSILKKVKAPKVLGYIFAGLILGQSGFNFITSNDIEAFNSFNVFALAVIGLLVGTEIKMSDFKRYGKQFLFILLGEGLSAFFLVSLLTGGVLFVVTGSWVISISGGLVFGAISSATDPASTMSVLWEKRASGVFTTTITAIVALDDALALFLYGLCSGTAQVITSSADASVMQEVFHVGIEILGSILLGIAVSFLIVWILSRSNNKSQESTTSFGIFLSSIALSQVLGLDIIIVTLTTGVIVSNKIPNYSKEFIKFMKSISEPVYIIFFVLIGARLTLGSMPSWLWILVGLFVIGRSLGKVTGAFLGAKISHASPTVQKYTGLGLFSQGGVAIGLAIVAGHHLDQITIVSGMTLGTAIISGVTATTFIIQLVGPTAVSIAANLSGEAGKKITMVDLIDSKDVDDVMKTNEPLNVLAEKDTVAHAVELFSSTSANLLPVVDENMVLKGVVTFESLRQILAESSFWQWSVVLDVMDYDTVSVNPSDKLKKILDFTHSVNLSQIPVVLDGKLVSVLDIHKVESDLKNELMKKQEASSIS